MYFLGEPRRGDLFYRRSPGSRDHLLTTRAHQLHFREIATGKIRGAQMAVGPDGRVHVALECVRTVRALKAIGGPAPDEIMQTLADQMRGGRFFRVDEATGEPIIDLRVLEAQGKLHLLKRVTRTSTTRAIQGKDGAPDIQETTKTLGVELYSAQDAAEILGRFLGMDKTKAEPPSALVDARALVLQQARAALDTLARTMYPGPPDPAPAKFTPVRPVRREP